VCMLFLLFALYPYRARRVSGIRLSRGNGSLSTEVNAEMNSSLLEIEAPIFEIPSDDPRAFPDPSKQFYDTMPNQVCRACEDAVQTWHERYSCDGAKAEYGHTNSMAPIICKYPMFTCDMLYADAAQTVCHEIEWKLMNEESTIETVWTSLKNMKSPYEACESINFCAGDTRGDRSPCHEALTSGSCRDHPMCEQGIKHCSATCFACYRLAEHFPVFKEGCKPSFTATKQPDNVIRSPGNTINKLADITIAHAKGKLYPDMNVLKEGKSPKYNEIDEKLPTPLCFEMWRAIRYSRKAFYYASYKRHSRFSLIPIDDTGNFSSWQLTASDEDGLYGSDWDANTVCKCLGKCPIQMLEGVHLERACKYTKYDQQAMEMLIPNSEYVGVFDTLGPYGQQFNESNIESSNLAPAPEVEASE